MARVKPILASDVAAMWRRGQSPDEIAERVGRGERTVRELLGGALSPAELRRMKAGKPARPSQAGHYAARQRRLAEGQAAGGCRRRARSPRKSGPGSAAVAALPPAHELARLYAQNLSLRQIGQRFDVSADTIRKRIGCEAAAMIALNRDELHARARLAAGIAAERSAHGVVEARQCVGCASDVQPGEIDEHGRFRCSHCGGTSFEVVSGQIARDNARKRPIAVAAADDGDDE
jgi:DNA-binding CsgD family transcriptional regulator